MIPQDPFMLLSYVNMKLRGEYDSLEDFCLSQDIKQEELEQKLKSVGFSYDPTAKQFR